MSDDGDSGVGPVVTYEADLERVERVGWTGQTRITGAPSWFSSFTTL